MTACDYLGVVPTSSPLACDESQSSWLVSLREGTCDA